MFDYLLELKIIYRSLKNQKQIKKYYVGELNSITKLPEGFGTCTKKYIKYTGEWLNGLPYGRGISIYKNPTFSQLYYYNDTTFDEFKYEGDFNKGMFNGKGILKKNNLKIYEGEFKNGSITGYGFIFNKNNDVLYKGYLLNGKFNGKGILYNSFNKIIYEGDWICGLKEGYGKLYNLNVSESEPLYIGYFKKNEYNGLGNFNNKNEKRIGKFENNKQIEHGTFEDENKKYIGMFKNNLFNGYGNLYWYSNKNNNIKLFNYSGFFLNNNMDGNGFIEYNNNDTYRGEFKNGFKNGKGIYYNSLNKYNINCIWENDLKNGKGTITYCDGTGFKCIWDNNKLISKKRLLFFEENYLKITFKNNKNIPIDLCCPISLEIMEDPVICSDGHTYDRKSILLLFKKNNPKSPKTRKILDKNILITNYNIKSIIENYKEF
jgi:hypothetical protein